MGGRNKIYVTVDDDNWFKVEDADITLDSQSFDEFVESCESTANHCEKLMEAKARHLAKLKSGEIVGGEETYLNFNGDWELDDRNTVGVGDKFLALSDSPQNTLSAYWQEGDELEVVSASWEDNEIELFVDTQDRWPDYTTYVTYIDFILYCMGEYLQPLEEANHDSIKGCFRMSAEDLKELCEVGAAILEADSPDKFEFYLWDPTHKTLTKTK